MLSSCHCLKESCSLVFFRTLCYLHSGLYLNKWHPLLFHTNDEWHGSLICLFKFFHEKYTLYYSCYISHRMAARCFCLQRKRYDTHTAGAGYYFVVARLDKKGLSHVKQLLMNFKLQFSVAFSFFNKPQ
jgi:hypothetical protein